MSDAQLPETRPVHAVLFDFGGVITTSPFEAFHRYENSVRAPRDTIRTINSTNPDNNAWAKMERSEVDTAGFAALFEAEAAALGHDMSGEAVLGCLSGGVRPYMVRALQVLKEHGIRIACITNNMKAGHGAGMARSEEQAAAVADAMSHFEMVIESSVEGLRKPDPAIYQLALDRMGIAAADAIYLDDLGINCKPAAALGMRAIKVTDGEKALADLEALVGIALR
ncbi:MAG: putative hydrolase of the HAD superfamily [Candidatus Poriferisodalaceae bacterium]|jgi:putative hydrolase of the HAD superfamily